MITHDALPHALNLRPDEQGRALPAASPILGNILIMLLCLFAFGASLFINRAVFDRLPHLEDEYAYLFQARTLARGDLVIETPQPRRAFWQPFVVDKADVRFSKYTPGWGLVLSLGTRAAGEGREWIVNALLASLTTALVFRIGADLFGRDTGLIAATLAAFSPMALLLNATYMGHTSALFAGVLALWAYLHLERSLSQSRAHAWAWALVGGLALGLLTANRPITGVAFALPLAVRAATRIQWQVRWFAPHVALSLAALGVFALVPAYNIAAVNDPTANLYTLVWEYDCVGFGTCGRNGHILEKAFRHTGFDLSLTAVDLFGWGYPFGVNFDARRHLVNDSDQYPIAGFSMILLPFGLALALGRRWWVGALWAAACAGWTLFAIGFDGGRLLTDPAFGWPFVAGALALTAAPLLLLRRHDRAAWAWVLWTTAAMLIILQLAYWIGSQRYSTRYYFEGLAGAALLSAIPIGAVLRRLTGRRRRIAGVGLAALLLLTLLSYTWPRIEVLRGYNRISQAQIAEVDRRRAGRDALVLVTGTDVRWRAYGALMASTSPYLDSPIVAALDSSGGANPAIREALLARFPDRLLIEMSANVNDAEFVDAPPG